MKLNQETLDLRWRILDSMRQQGFVIHSGQLTAPDPADKERLRSLHATSVKHRVEQAREGLLRHEDRLLGYIANGSEVLPDRICPRLIEVEAGSEEELLFRYARLHWSIPVSAGYGRRALFLVADEANGKLMGLFGLCDPVYGLAPRDRWVGWNKEEKRERLRNVMDAFVLGAVPPYSSLLCGKLVALMVTDEVREAVRRRARYGTECAPGAAWPYAHDCRSSRRRIRGLSISVQHIPKEVVRSALGVQSGLIAGNPGNPGTGKGLAPPPRSGCCADGRLSNTTGYPRLSPGSGPGGIERLRANALIKQRLQQPRLPRA